MIFDSQWKLGGLLGVVALVCGVIGWLALSRANLKVALAETQARATVCQAANADWQVKADAFQAAMQKLREGQAARERRAAQVVLDSRREAESHADRAAKIMGTKPLADDCQSAFSLVKTYLRDRR